MAVMGGVGCGGNVRLRRYNKYSNLFNVPNPSAPSCSLMVSSKLRTSKILAMTSSSSKVGTLQSLPKQAEKKHKEFSYENIDDWMRESVAEIVKKLPESPLLIHVYSDDNKTTKTKAEKAEEEKWVSMKQKWNKGESPMPDGVIFVEQIEQEEEGQGEKNAWGIVVQGRKGEPPACYLLKTSKVSSGFGLRCTHFSLVKVTSFRESAFSRLKNCWLSQAN